MSITLVVPESREEYAAIVAFYGALAPKFGGEQPAKVEVKQPKKEKPAETVTAPETVEKAETVTAAPETVEKSETVSLDFVREKIAAATEKDEDNRGKIVSWIKGQGFKSLPTLDPEKYSELLTFIASL